MKCISLWQPWATLLVHGLRKYEIRRRSTSHRGPLLIHASKARQGLRVLNISDIDQTVQDALYSLGYGCPKKQLPRGLVIGVVDVVTMRLRSSPLNPGPPGSCFGDFRSGRWAWECASPRVLATPIPFRDRLGIFDVPDELLVGVQWLTPNGGSAT